MGILGQYMKQGITNYVTQEGGGVSTSMTMYNISMVTNPQWPKQSVT